MKWVKDEMAIKSFRDLRVWKAAMDLVEQVYRLSQKFPKQETFGLTSQMQRAAVSVPSNIAEGHTREHLNEYLHHLSMAHASLSELETQLEIAFRLEYLPSDQFNQIIQQATSLSRQLYALRNALMKKPNTQHLTPNTQHPTPIGKKTCIGTETSPF